MEPGADEHVRDQAPQALRVGEPPEHRLPHGQRRGHVLQPEARHLLDEVDLAADVPRPPARHVHRPPFVDGEAEPRQPLPLLRLVHREAEHLVRVAGAERDPRRHRQLAAYLGLAGEARTCELDEQLRRVGRRGGGQLGIDPLLPSGLALGTEVVARAAPDHRQQLEVRRLEHDRRGGLADLGVLAAHHAGDRDRTLGVGDHEVVGIELPARAVERDELLAGPRPANHDAAALQRGVVEGVQRAAEREHHVVRDVDDVRDRAHAGAQEPRLEPGRRLTHLHVPEEAPDVTRAAVEVVDADLQRLVAGASRIPARGRPQLGPCQSRHLACDPVDRRQVGPVVERLDLEHVVSQRQHVRQRGARLERVRQQHDAAVVLAELELALGEDHPLRDLAAQLAALDREGAAGHDAAGHDHRDGRARAEVPGAADDRARLPVADVDARQLQPVRVRMLACLQHLADHEVLEVAAGVGHAAPDDTVDLAAREDEPPRELLDRQVEVDVLPQPRDGHLHQNCPRTRRSFSQNMRRSGRPWRSMAIRSIPKPNAKPCHSVRVELDVAEHVGVDPAGTAHLDPAGVLARGAADAAADEAGDVELDRRLGEGEVARAHAHLALGAEERPEELQHGALEVGQGDAPVDRQALDLEEDRRVGRVGGVAAVAAAGRDHVDRRRPREHRPDLVGRGMGAQHGVVVDVERLEGRPRGVVERLGERVEVLPHGRHLVAVPDLVAHAEEHVLDLALDLREQVQAPAAHRRAGHRDVDAALAGPPAGELRELLRALLDRLLEPRADAVQEHAALAVANAAQRLGELRLATGERARAPPRARPRRRLRPLRPSLPLRRRSSSPRRDYLQAPPSLRRGVDSGPGALEGR